MHYVISANGIVVQMPRTDIEVLFSKFYNAKDLLKRYANLAAITTFFMIMKVLDFMNSSHRLGLLTKTLGLARVDIFYFLFVLITLLMGFIGMAHLQFGFAIEEYSHFSWSMRMCLELIFG